MIRVRPSDDYFLAFHALHPCIDNHAGKMVDPNELSLLLLNYSKNPTPIQNLQSWSTEFGQERSSYEIQERDREIRRQRSQQRSKEGFLEVLIVVGVLALIFLPILVWLYYKSGLCETAHDERQLQRPTSHGMTPESSESQHRETYYTPTDSLKGVQVASSHPRPGREREPGTPRRLYHTPLGSPREFKATPIRTTKIEYESPSPTLKALRNVRDVGLYAYNENRERDRNRPGAGTGKGKVFV